MAVPRVSGIGESGGDRIAITPSAGAPRLIAVLRGGALAFLAAGPATLLLPLLAAFALRLYRLGEQDVWWDEGFSVWISRQDLASLTLRTASDTHPPFYYWLLHGWIALVGDGEFAARYLSVLFGVLAVAATYALGRRVFGNRVALLAAALLAASRFHIWWSQEIRMYSVAIVAVVLSSYFFLRLVSRPGVLLAAAYCLFTLVGLYSLYLTSLTLLVQNLFVLILLARRHKGRWRLSLSWLAVQLAIVVAYAPWLLLALPRVARISSAEPFDGILFVRVYWTVLSLGVSANVEQHATAALAVLVVALSGILAALGLRRLGRQAALAYFLLALLLIPIFVYLLSTPRADGYTPRLSVRYLVILAPFCYLVIAAGIQALRQLASATALRVLVTGGALATLAVAFAGVLPDYYGQRYLRDDYQTALAYVAAAAHPGDAIVLYPDDDWPVFAYHWREQLRWYGFPGRQEATPEAIDHFFRPILARHGRVWLLTTGRALSTDPQHNAERWLETQAAHASPWAVNDKTVALYLSRQAGANEPAASGFSERASPPRLLRVHRSISEVRPGDALYLLTFWTAIPDELTLRLVDSTGTTAHQRQRSSSTSARLVDGSIVVPLRLPIPSTVPAGTYRLDLLGGSPDVVSLGRLRVLASPLPPAPLDVGVPLAATFGERIGLLGYRLGETGAAPRLRPGAVLPVTIFWEAFDEIEVSYTVFVHLLGSAYNPRQGNHLWGQSDSPPRGGAFPTTAWSPGQRLSDEHLVPVDAGIPAGDYEVEIGLYDPATGQRLKTASGEDRVVLATLYIE